MWEKLRDCSDTMLKRMAGYDEPFANQCRGAFYSAILYAETQMGDYGQVHAHFAEYIRDGKLNAIGKCSVYLRELEALYAEVRKAESGDGGAVDGAENASEYSAASVLECWRRIAEDTAAYLENWDAQSRWQLDEQQQTIQDSIVLVNHAVDDRSHIWVSNLRLLALHYTGSTGEEVQQGAQDAEGRLRSSMEGKGDFLWFDETYWELGKAGILAMEEILLSLSLAQWMALVYALKKIDSIKKWEEARRRVEEIRTQDDIRYSYFFMNYYNETAAHLAGAQSLAQAETFLAEISGWNLNYAKRVYTDAAFEGEMEMLPDNCRAAVYLDRAMSCSGDAWNEKLENLRLAVNTWPRLAENVKNYAKLLGEERKRQEEEARRAQDELQQMKEGVLQQILILMQNGMGAQALAALGQLRGLLPADAELAELEEELKGKLAAE
jgi:hypothetical protein